MRKMQSDYEQMKAQLKIDEALKMSSESESEQLIDRYKREKRIERFNEEI